MTALSSHHYLFEPAKSSDAAPFLVLHGTGGTEHDLLPLVRTLAPGSAILSPRGNVTEQGAARYFARLAPGVFDPDEIIRRTHELADFVLGAAEHHHLDLSRLTALGFSNGANIAATLLLLRPETLGAAVLLRPMVVLDQPAPPGSLAGKRVLLASGSGDSLVPVDQPPHLAELLRTGGADVEIAWTRADHGLTAVDFSAARAWLARG
ncbi:alpha/beta hydrolase [Horticoccus luteus]|uniref:Alpha/beta hydrolase n=1 Tax=Horticoccus luteus TaxID=2862869 RepID=A0A8F9XF73_9BACT|nr:alpha/beta hydrolase [Horticoccus luteus]QYM77782.1 alpha/beta hydrolase [Horticoccus luteus]